MVEYRLTEEILVYDILIAVSIAQIVSMRLACFVAWSWEKTLVLSALVMACRRWPMRYTETSRENIHEWCLARSLRRNKRTVDLCCSANLWLWGVRFVYREISCHTKYLDGLLDLRRLASGLQFGRRMHIIFTAHTISLKWSIGVVIFV